MMPNKIPALFALSFFVSALTYHLTPAFAADEQQIRVVILEKAESIRMTMLAPSQLRDLQDGTVLADFQRLKWTQIKPSNPGLTIGNQTFSAQAVLLEPKEEVVFRVNSIAYRGSLILRRTEQGRLMVINRLGLEEYLVGALTSETNPKWPEEALKAHAVVSRTMVAHRIWIRKQKPFDVTADTRTHLYYGVRAERRKTRKAVNQTRGQVLVYNGELLSTTFHANCGGHTEDAAELWSVKGDLKPLTGVPDPHCRNRRHYRWKRNIRRSQFMEAIGFKESLIGSLDQIRILDRNRSGRVRAVKVVGTQGVLKFTGKEFRNLLGVNRLRSLNFNVELTPKVVSFRGFGWGHGVGFCQWGAYGMARRNRKVDEILSFYFPGTQRRNLKGLPGFS